MADNFIRKQVVFNRKSEAHMKILTEVKKRSNNFSGYVMSVLDKHFNVPTHEKEADSPPPKLFKK